MIAGTCPCSPAGLAEPALAEHLPLSLFMVKHCHCPFGQLLLRALSGGRWSRAQGLPFLQSLRCCHPVLRTLNEQIPVAHGGAGLGQELPLALKEYFQNRALTVPKESVLAALLQA